MKKEAIMPVAVLTIICVVVAALLGAVNMLTRDKIRDNALKKEQASLIEVMPGASTFEEVAIPSEAPKTVKSAYREVGGRGYVFIIVAEKTDYSSGDMTLSVGISDGKVVGATLTSYNESKDLGKTTYPSKFIGTSSADYDSVEVTSGVTYSSKAFKSAIGDALAAEAILDGEETASLLLPAYLSSAPAENTEVDLDTLVSELVGGAAYTEEAIPQNADATLKHLWSVEKGGYAMHIVVAGAYVPVAATEAVMYVNGYGEIESINLLKWIVGHGTEPGGFADGFIGKNIYTINDTELVSGSTGTSGDFKNAAILAVSLVSSYMEEEIMLHLVDGLVPFAREFEKLELPEGAPSTLKALYSAKNGRGTVAHIVVPGEWVPVASNALVYFDQYGTIQGVEILQWIVGHGIDEGDFPERLVGATEETLSEVELVTGCTGTSGDLRSAISDAYPSIPTESTAGKTALQIISASVIVVSLGALVSYLIISRKRRMSK